VQASYKTLNANATIDYSSENSVMCRMEEFVDHPEQVRLETRPRGRGIRILVLIAKDDIGISRSCRSETRRALLVVVQEMIGNHCKQSDSKT
jgi:hypothetical protein